MVNRTEAVVLWIRFIDECINYHVWPAIPAVHKCTAIRRDAVHTGFMKNLIRFVLMSSLAASTFACAAEEGPEKAAATARVEAADARVNAADANARLKAADAHVKAADARVGAADA